MSLPSLSMAISGVSPVSRASSSDLYKLATISHVQHIINTLRIFAVFGRITLSLLLLEQAISFSWYLGLSYMIYVQSLYVTSCLFCTIRTPIIFSSNNILTQGKHF
jgi:hypothetical protein